LGQSAEGSGSIGSHKMDSWTTLHYTTTPHYLSKCSVVSVLCAWSLVEGRHLWATIPKYWYTARTEVNWPVTSRPSYTTRSLVTRVTTWSAAAKLGRLVLSQFMPCVCSLSRWKALCSLTPVHHVLFQESWRHSELGCSKICSWLPPFCKQNPLLFIQPRWQLRRTYFVITIMFSFNEFAFTVQVKHKINSIQILGFFDILVFYDWPFPHVCTLQRM